MTGRTQGRRLDRLETTWRATPGADTVWERTLAMVAEAEGVAPDALRAEAARILAERSPDETARQFAGRLAAVRGMDGVAVDRILDAAEAMVTRREQHL